ncbi:MAG: hypothetical protein RI947_1377 [Candidatus Parcubacteria bacterium]|jgi:hypothetical protein
MRHILIGGTAIIVVSTIGFGFAIKNAIYRHPAKPKTNTTSFITPSTKTATDEAVLAASSAAVVYRSIPSPSPKISTSVTPTVQVTKASKGTVIIDDISPIPNGATITNTEPCITVTYHKTNDANMILMQWKVDSGNWIGWNGVYHLCVFYGLTSGSHSVSVQLKDNYGNLSEVVTRSFTISDTKPPVFYEFVGGAQEGSVLTFSPCLGWAYHDEVTGNSGMDYRYKLDSNDWTGYSTEGRACVTLANGSHTLSVQAKDINGNESGVTTTHFSVQMPDGATTAPPQEPTSSPPTDTPPPVESTETP